MFFCIILMTLISMSFLIFVMHSEVYQQRSHNCLTSDWLGFCFQLHMPTPRASYFSLCTLMARFYHFPNIVPGYAISSQKGNWNTETCIFICLIITFINRNIKLHSNHYTQFIVHVLDTWIWNTLNCVRLYIFWKRTCQSYPLLEALEEVHQFLTTEQILQNITHLCLYQWYSPHIQVIPMCPFQFGAITHNKIAGIERFWKEERTIFV